MSTVYQDGVTPLDASHMNALQQKVEKGQPSGYVPLDSSSNVPLVAASKIVWGGDTNLYRSAAGKLRTDGEFDAGGQVVANLGAATQVVLGTAGGHAWIGFGSTPDVALYRSAAGTLQTDGTLNVGSENVSGTLNGWVSGDPNPRIVLAPNYTGGNPGLVFGPGATAGDTNLYRKAANQLATVGQFFANDGAATQVALGATGSAQPAVFFGPALDSNIYRLSAGVLQTDGCLRVQGGGAAIGATGVSGLLLNFLNVVQGWVQVGDPDSGGSGFRVLRVSN